MRRRSGTSSGRTKVTQRSLNSSKDLAAYSRSDSDSVCITASHICRGLTVFACMVCCVSNKDMQRLSHKSLSGNSGCRLSSGSQHLHLGFGRRRGFQACKRLAALGSPEKERARWCGLRAHSPRRRRSHGQSVSQSVERLFSSSRRRLCIV